MSNSTDTAANKITIVLLMTAIFGCSLLIFFMPIDVILKQSQQIKSLLAGTGNAAPMIFAFGTALLTAIGMPRLLFCSLAGVIFGFTWGFLLSHFGTLLGAYGTFLFSRWSGRDYIQKKFPKINSLSQSMHSKGWQSVLFMRQLPINGLYNDMLLGISSVTHFDFWLGSFLGFMPLGVAATLAGAGALQADIHNLAKYVGIATVTFFLITLSLKWILSQWQRKSLGIS